METVLVVGAPGIGKSTALNLLLSHWKSGDPKTALMDGDQVARMSPMNEAERLALVSENIFACGKQFETNGVRLFVAACCFASKESIDLLVRRLRKCGWPVHLIALVAADEDLIGRNEKRGSSPVEETDFFDQVKDTNATVGRLEDAFVLDTSGMTGEEVAEELAGVIRRLPRCPAAESELGATKPSTRTQGL